MTPEQYWKIRAAVADRKALEHQIKALEQQANDALKAAVAKVGQALTEAGLDPLGTYEMNDEAQVCTPVAATLETAGPVLAVDNE